VGGLTWFFFVWTCEAHGPMPVSPRNSTGWARMRSRGRKLGQCNGPLHACPSSVAPKRAAGRANGQQASKRVDAVREDAVTHFSFAYPHRGETGRTCPVARVLANQPVYSSPGIHCTSVAIGRLQRNNMPVLALQRSVRATYDGLLVILGAHGRVDACTLSH